MENKIKVLHLLSSNRFSGAENMVTQIIKMFENDHIEMGYCSPDGPILHSLKERNIPFISLEKSSTKEIKRVINKFKPDIIHAHDIRASVIAAKFGKKIKIISHIHGNHENMRVINLKTFLFTYSSMSFEKIFWVSNSALRDFKFKKYIQQKSEVLPNILDIKEVEKKLAEDSNKYPYEIVFVGRMTYAKNPKRLIDILELVIRINPSIKAALIGEGELLESVKEYTKAKMIDKNIEFLGFLENPLKIMHDAKVMILTSFYEGTPMCALESMALGVPIVSTPTDGLVELINHGTTGYVTASNEEFSNFILKIINDDLIKEKMSNQTRIKAEELNDINTYKNKLSEVYYG